MSEIDPQHKIIPIKNISPGFQLVCDVIGGEPVYRLIEGQAEIARWHNELPTASTVKVITNFDKGL